MLQQVGFFPTATNFRTNEWSIYHIQLGLLATVIETLKHLQVALPINEAMMSMLDNYSFMSRSRLVHVSFTSVALMTLSVWVSSTLRQLTSPLLVRKHW